MSDPTGLEAWAALPSEKREWWQGGGLDSQHSAAGVDNAGINDAGKSESGIPGLYDPNGSREMIGPNTPGNVEGVPGNLNVQVGEGVTVQNYVDTQFATYDNIDAVVVVNIPTTPAQDAEIISNGLKIGAGGGISCTCNVSDAIGGVGPIPDMGTVWIPNDLRDQLQNQFGSTTYY